MVIDAETNESIEFYENCFVNGSTLGSTFILLNSTEAHPNGLEMPVVN
jgi:hypothetical protein